MKHRILVILAVVAIMLFVGSVAYAASYTLNQTKTGTITVTASGGGGGGGGDTTINLLVYEDTALTTPVSNLDMSYPVNSSASKTVYAPIQAGTVNTVGAVVDNPGNLDISVSLGTATATYIPVIISVSGGTEGTHSYSVNFKN